MATSKIPIRFTKTTKHITFAVYNTDGITPISIGGKISTRIQSPFTGVIVGWKLNSNVETTATIDIWKHSTNPTNANSITASAKPTLVAANKNNSSTLTGWSTSISENDLLQIEIEANDLSTDLKLTLILEV